ncbi:MAG: DUF4389 domain-containing protein [Dehalococcoidales bacterium]|nr:DUF4389 domain-containing protein [Dehalococcoidales bacterium]
MADQEAYPLTLKGELTNPPARGWWLIKWLLIIPHLVVLCFLVIAAAVVWVIAFFAILFTEKYPKSLFDFMVGVMRWCWRVSFYSYSALGTDKYPPFTLKPVADYPAELDVVYPEKLSRGLVLVKWWLLAIPHYAVVAALTSGGAFAWQQTEKMRFEGLGLLSVLVIIAAFVLLFTGKYHADIFRLVMGINRWAYRVGAYVALMTDKYPPFRLWD